MEARRFQIPAASGWPEASTPAASTISSILRPSVRWSGPGCWRCATSRPGRATARMHRARAASITGLRKASRSAGAFCEHSSTPGSTATKTAARCSMDCSSTSRAAGAASSITATVSPRCNRPRVSDTSFRSPMGRRPIPVRDAGPGCSTTSVRSAACRRSSIRIPRRSTGAAMPASPIAISNPGPTWSRRPRSAAISSRAPSTAPAPCRSPSAACSAATAQTG